MGLKRDAELHPLSLTRESLFFVGLLLRTISTPYLASLWGRTQGKVSVIRDRDTQCALLFTHRNGENVVLLGRREFPAHRSG